MIVDLYGGFPFFTGTQATAPVRLPDLSCALNGRPYLIDLASGAFQMASVPALRPQADGSNATGQQTLSVEGLWRQGPETWHHGAGQTYYDREGSDPARFFASRGVDPWTKWSAELLSDAEAVGTVAGATSAAVATVDGIEQLVVAGDTVVAFEPDGAPTTISGLTGNTRVCSDGRTAYVADTTGVFTIETDSASVLSFNTHLTGVDAIALVKQRLLAGKDEALWDLVDDTTATAEWTHPSVGWKWTGFADGQSVIYASGYVGQRGAVFAISLLDDGSGLDVPVQACELPDGEIPYAIATYQGYVLLGTNKGVRFATADGNSITPGAIVGSSPCRCFEPQDRFVWFGWDRTFTDASGLGRMDLTAFIADLAPAFATDLVVTKSLVTQTVAVATFNDRRWFVLSDGTVAREAEEKLLTGYIDSGWLTFGISDRKVAARATVSHQPLAIGESVIVSIATPADTLPGSAIGESSLVGSIGPTEDFLLSNLEGEAFAVRITLRSSGTSTPMLTSAELRSQPAPDRSMRWIVPLVFADVIEANDYQYPMDVADEHKRIQELVRSQRIVRWQIGQSSYSVFVEDFRMAPDKLSESGNAYGGTMIVSLKEAA